MADISKITLPSGTTYNIKDATARQAIAAITGGDAIVFKGVSSTVLKDGENQNPTISGSQVTTKNTGDLYFYGTAEFIYGSDSKWHELGNLNSLGDLATKNSASGSYTPAGTVTKPTFTGSSSSVTITATNNTNGNYQPAGSISGGAFTGSNTTFTGSFTPEGTVTTTTKSTTNKTATVSETTGTVTYTPGGSVSAPTISLSSAGSTTTIKNPTSQTVAKTIAVAAPGATAPANAVTYYSVANETLSLYQIGYTTGNSITTSNVTVKTGDGSYSASQPEFTGTGVRLITGNIAVPSAYTSTFSGTSGSVSTSGTPNGSNGALSFTGTKVQLSGTTTASGSVSQPTFNGTQATITVS